MVWAKYSLFKYLDPLGIWYMNHKSFQSLRMSCGFSQAVDARPLSSFDFLRRD